MHQKVSQIDYREKSSMQNQNNIAVPSTRGILKRNHYDGNRSRSVSSEENFQQALEFGGCPLVPSKRCDSFTSSEESAPALTDCSSRSSFQDLDHLSVGDFDEFKDALDHVPSDQDPPAMSCIPRILRPQPRTVSFAGLDEVFDEQHCRKPCYRQPKTPMPVWYPSSKHASKISSLGKPPRIPTYNSSPLLTSPPAPYASGNIFLQEPQQRYSAFPKSHACSNDSWCEAAVVQPPSSPQLTWYAPKKWWQCQSSPRTPT